MRFRIFILALIVGFEGFPNQQYVLFEKDGRMGLYQPNGEIAIPAVYDKLGWTKGNADLHGELIGYQEYGKWGLINVKNKRVTKPIYNQLLPYDSTHVKAAIKGKFTNHLFYGLIDVEGNVKISCNYFDIQPLHGNHIVSSYERGAIKEGLYNSDYQLTVPVIHREVSGLSKSIVGARSFRGRLSIYQPKTGVIIAEVDDCQLIENELILVSKGKQGLLDQHGRFILPIAYKSIQSANVFTQFPRWELSTLDMEPIDSVAADSIGLNNNMLILHLNGSHDALVDGKDLFKDRMVTIKQAQSGYVIAQDIYEKTWSLMNTSGQNIIGGQDSIYFDGIYFYTLNESIWQVYNRFGRKITARDYQGLKPAINNHVPVKRNEYWGMLDFQGKHVITVKYDQIGTGTNNMLAVKYIGSWGVLNMFDEWELSPSFDTAWVTTNTLMAKEGDQLTVKLQTGEKVYQGYFSVADRDEYLEVKSEIGVGLINLNGKVLLDPIFDKVGKYGDNYWGQRGNEAVMLSEDGDYYINANDQVSKVLGFSESFFMVKKHNKYGFVDDQGRLRIANRYDSAKLFSEGIAPISLNGKWGCVNRFENLVIQPLYDDISTFDNGVAIFEKEGKFGLINHEGTVLLNPEFSTITHKGGSGYIFTDFSGMVGATDQTGSIVLQPNYKYIYETPNQLLIVQRGEKFGVMDLKGYTKVPFQYANIKVVGDYFVMKLPD
ncbi:MAG: WG repeat-containing protein [Cyclobacteriaceae bacterium]